MCKVKSKQIKRFPIIMVLLMGKCTKRFHHKIFRSKMFWKQFLQTFTSIHLQQAPNSDVGQSSTWWNVGTKIKISFWIFPWGYQLIRVLTQTKQPCWLKIFPTQSVKISRLFQSAEREERQKMYQLVMKIGIGTVKDIMERKSKSDNKKYYCFWKTLSSIKICVA